MDGCISFYRRKIVGPLSTVLRGLEWCQSSLVDQLQRELNISSSAFGLNVSKMVTFITTNFTFGIDESFPWSRVWRWQLLFNFGNVFWMQVVEQTLANQIILMVQNKTVCINVKNFTVSEHGDHCQESIPECNWEFYKQTPRQTESFHDRNQLQRGSHRRPAERERRRVFKQILKVFHKINS